EVASSSFARTPALTIAFDAGKFCNRLIEVHPFKLAGPEQIKVGRVGTSLPLDGRVENETWKPASGHPLLGLPPRGGRNAWVALLADKDWLYTGARLDDPNSKVSVRPPDPEAESSRAVLFEEHFRVHLWDGKQTRTFAVSPGHVRYSNLDRDEEKDHLWRGAVGQQHGNR